MADLNISEQLRKLQASVDSLSQRVATLEGRRVTPVAPVASSPTPISTTATAAKKPTGQYNSNTAFRVMLAIVGVAFLAAGSLSPILGILGIISIILAIFWPWGKKTVSPAATQATATSQTAAVAPKIPATKRVPSQFEQDLAKHWFSWLGVISLVVGVTLFLGYALRGYGPLGRVLTGYAAAGMLFGITAWFWKPYRSFAVALESGAWAIVYLSTYALHSTAGFGSALTGGLLLMLVVVLIMMAALWQKSRALTGGAFLLGYIAAITNSVDLFTLSAMVILAVGLVAVSSYKRWPDFVLAGTILTYIVQFAWMVNLGQRLALSVSTGAAFLVAEVLIFGLSHWLNHPPDKKQRDMIVGGTVANVVGFYWLLQYLISYAHSANGWMATLFIAIVCGLLAGLTKIISGRDHLRTVYTVFAISFLTIAFAQHWHGDSLTTAWLVEAGALLSIGISSRTRTVRYMGYLVSVFALSALAITMAGPLTYFGTTHVHSRVVLSLLGAIAFGVSAAVARSKRSELPSEEKYAAAVLADIAIAILIFIAGQELPHAWVPVAWGALATLAIAIGTEIRSLNSRIVGYAVHVLALLYWISNVASSTAMAGSLAVHSRLLAGLWLVAIAGVSAWDVARQAAALRPGELIASKVLWWLATITLTFVLGAEVARGFISIAWGLQGISLYLIGFARQSLSARRQGLAVIGLTIAKVYIYDVQTLSTQNRILSFIILGVLLMVIGYLYNRWRQKTKTSS